jgi:hypothetical protein
MALPRITHKFTIKDSEWVHAAEDGEIEGGVSDLRLRHNGKKCCLGFYALSCGLTSKQITGKANPEDLLPGVVDDNPPSKALPPQFLKTMFTTKKVQRNIVDKLMAVNDGGKMALDERKAKITKLFRTLGVGVTFITEKKSKKK